MIKTTVKTIQNRNNRRIWMWQLGCFLEIQQKEEKSHIAVCYNDINKIVKLVESDSSSIPQICEVVMQKTTSLRLPNWQFYLNIPLIRCFQLRKNLLPEDILYLLYIYIHTAVLWNKSHQMLSVLSSSLLGSVVLTIPSRPPPFCKFEVARPYPPRSCAF